MKTFEVLSINDTLKLIIKSCEPTDKVQSIQVPTDRAEQIEELIQNSKNVIFNTKNGNISSTDEDKIGKKTIIKSKLKNDFLKFNTIDSMVSVMVYVDVLMDLGNRGYFITDKNREEKYIEIIETGDEELISLLEGFLTSKDTTDSLKWHRERLNNRLKKLDELDEDTEAFEDFIREL